MHILIGILQHNKYGITKRCIDKIIENTNDVSYDIFLIDNGSIDGSANSIKKIYNEIDNIKIVLNEKNSGVIGGRNLIFNHFLSEIKYSHIIFLDNDQFVNDKWMDGYLSGLKKFDQCIIGTEGWLLSSSLSPMRKVNLKDVGFTYIGCGGMMIDRKSVEDIGIFDIGFNPAYFEDTDYCLRARDKGIKVIWNNISKIDHKPHQTLGQNHSVSSKNFLKSFLHFKSKCNNKINGGSIFTERVL